MEKKNEINGRQLPNLSQDSPAQKLDLHYLSSSEAIKQLQSFLKQRETVLRYEVGCVYNFT